MEKVRIGLIGCGGITRAHIRGIKTLFQQGWNEMEITCVCDERKEVAEERAQNISEFQKNKPLIFTDYEKLLSKKLCDGFVLCLPHFLHHSIGLEILKNNFHVMIEKPLALTLKAGMKLVEEAKRKNLILSIAEQVRRTLFPRAIKWIIENKKFVGDVKHGVVMLVNYSPFNYTNYSMKWRGVKALSGGGIIFDSGHHFADMLLYLFGEVDEIYCEIRSYDERIIEDIPILGTHKADVEDTYSAIIKFKNDIFITWIYSRSSPGTNLNTAIYVGENGSIKDKGFVFHCFEGGAEILLHLKTIDSEEIKNIFLKSLTKEEREKLFPYNCYDGFGLEWLEFVRAIKNNKKVEIDGEEGLKIMAFCESFYESNYLKKPVKFEDVYNGKIQNYQKEINDFWKIK
jgi:predicted dehydrogenase